ncbi:unnamed protein product [Sphenostylis stenocarpa]|uniref:Uncharacterized protein n=1 Tax=Sphenostylis stenocarpa TaxID=92480 RepID=A0AA86SUP6_9FABA|nr:unnamed protein product [Sphenostylis stenocarpa]
MYLEPSVVERIVLRVDLKTLKYENLFEEELELVYHRNNEVFEEKVLTLDSKLLLE